MSLANSGSAKAPCFPLLQREDSAPATALEPQSSRMALLWARWPGSARQEDLEESDLSEVQAVWNPGWG